VKKKKMLTAPCEENVVKRETRDKISSVGGGGGGGGGGRGGGGGEGGGGGG